MNKIEDAIYQIHYIDNISQEGRALNKIHPLAKLLITLFYLVLLTSIDKYDLNTTLAMGIYLIVISIIFDLSIKKCIKRLKVVFVLLFIIGIANPILDRTVIIYLGIVPITTGLVSMITLALKGAFAIISAYFLVCSTSIESICYALKLLHLPDILITVFMLIYRYIIVLLKEIERMWIAYFMRAPKQKGINYKVWGSMIGSLMIRSIDKAQNVYESMELRGFNPDTFYIKEYKKDKKSIVYFIFGILVIFIIRFIPIFEIIGNLFV